MTDEELYAAMIEALGRFDTEAELVARLKGFRQAPLSVVEGPLGSDLLRHLHEEKDPLVLVLRAHLYFEAFLDAILGRMFRHASILLKNRDFTFSMKLDVLRASSHLDGRIYNDVKVLNRLRNKFGHDLYFDIGTFDMGLFTYCDGLRGAMNTLQTAEAKALVNVYVFRNVVGDLLIQLTKRHKFLAAIRRPD